MGWAAAAMRRAWYGLNPEIRKSRAHTQKGDFVLGTPRQAFDCVMVVATGAARKLAGVRPAWPWITFPAMRFVRRRLKGGLRVFEWGCGMSTVWFERRGCEVYGVEDSVVWYERVRRRVTRAQLWLLEGAAYVDKIREFPPGYFGLISVDGSQRLACSRAALEHASPGTMVLVDNTDNDRTTGGELFVIDAMIEQLGPDWRVHRVPGFGPCNFFAWETTVCVRR